MGVPNVRRVVSMSFRRPVSLGGMSEIHVHQFMTLDGVADAPVWSFEYEFLPEMAATLTKVTDASKAILLGRHTYEMFEPAWSTRTVEDDPGAPFFNETKKYVVSGTLTDPTWNNSRGHRRLRPGADPQLKAKVDGNLFVSGSTTLVRACSPTAWSTASTSSSTRSPAARASDCSTACRRSRSRARSPRPTRTA